MDNLGLMCCLERNGGSETLELVMMAEREWTKATIE
jgi:hypothetical protein